VDGRNMPLLTELENVLELRCYKDFAPDGADGPAQGRRDAAAAGVIFSGQSLCEAQSQNCETKTSGDHAARGAGGLERLGIITLWT
jgi:hypothetical protein